MIALFIWRLVYTVLAAIGATLIYLSIRSDYTLPSNGAVPFLVGVVCLILCSFMWRRVYP